MTTEKYPRRILIVAFKAPSKEYFNLVEQSNSMIIGVNTKIEIQNMRLKIEYKSYDEGQNLRGNHNYSFSYMNKEFLLTSAEGFRTDGLWVTRYVFDFIGQKWELTKGKMPVGDPAKPFKSLDHIKPKSMREFERPFTWHITEDIFL